MELQLSTPDLENPNNGIPLSAQQPHLLSEDFDSTCSTPYVSAPSSPGRGAGPGPINGGFFYSCPASPMHFAITTSAASYSVSAVSSPDNGNGSVPIGYEFEFSARLGSSGSGQTGSMSSADELFLNGQIRPTKLSTHLERPQVLAPLLDIDNEEEEEDDMDIKNNGRKVSGESTRGRDLRLRDKSLRRRTRSMSPLRSTLFEFANDDEDSKKNQIHCSTDESCESSGLEANENIKLEESATPSVSASSSRSSSAGRNSKRWVFLKDFLYRSKSEGRSNNKFWSNISFSPAKEKKSTRPASLQVPAATKEKVANASAVSMENQKVKGSGMPSGKKPVNGVGKRRVPTSPHELHYKASKAQAEEMRKKTFLPYRQGLLGCLGFSSKGYGAMNGFARALNPVSSR
ncbi:uncharacterized protein LOC110620046 [Manihot esculenta]|uniref:Uncharacterized protein n=1 Tax=Manihot esculenta TaxID=3983 RepID=A0A2C9VFE8_MANES|nr:uncharacterized protein LOC110620046 [Manihot esculenta]OAY43974.1 hypothetical protein MANES_08G112500v8 [Manihot esculenta]